MLKLPCLFIVEGRTCFIYQAAGIADNLPVQEVCSPFVIRLHFYVLAASHLQRTARVRVEHACCPVVGERRGHTVQHCQRVLLFSLLDVGGDDDLRVGECDVDGLSLLVESREVQSYNGSVVR